MCMLSEQNQYFVSNLKSEGYQEEPQLKVSQRWAQSAHGAVQEQLDESHQ